VAPPVSISVPAIGVRSDLLTLGLNPDGTLEVPQPGPDYDKAAWFGDSPRPGDVGPAVIEGHVDSAANGPSVFYRLGDLVVGDRIDVTREDGTVAGFVVDEVRVVPKTDFPTFDVYSNTDGPALRLITCGGPFDSKARSYLDNIVVFASLVA
jgi:LPXTG-site transpeptidase (sortase) family protein